MKSAAPAMRFARKYDVSLYWFFDGDASGTGRHRRLHSWPPPLLLCGRLTSSGGRIGSPGQIAQPGLSFALGRDRRLDKRRKREQSYG
jgi:hypothetical protein